MRISSWPSVIILYYNIILLYINYWKQFTYVSSLFAEGVEKNGEKCHWYGVAQAFQTVKLCAQLNNMYLNEKYKDCTSEKWKALSGHNKNWVFILGP